MRAAGINLPENGDVRMVRRSLMVATMVILLVSCATANANAGPTFYGFIKLDASLDSALTNNGNFAQVVLPYAEGEEHSELNMTANQTRLGVKFDGPDGDGVDTSGRIEFDFYGGGPENKPAPVLRHAYLEMKFAAMNLLAGQTSDIISPIAPATLNYIVLWKNGNTGFRRPQIRLASATKLGEGTKLAYAVSANRSMGRGYDGEAIGMPSFQGRVAVSTTLVGDKPMTIGVGGLWGREESTSADSLGASTVYELDATGMFVDVVLPLGDMVTLKGEYFSGKNLGVYFGGIGQGIAEVPAEETRNTEPVEIEASGWWAQLSVKATETVAFNVGAGADDPEIPDGDTANDLEKNTAYYGNVVWTVAPSATIGAEYAVFETEYVGGESYQNNRMQLSFMYKF